MTTKTKLNLARKQTLKQNWPGKPMRQVIKYILKNKFNTPKALNRKPKNGRIHIIINANDKIKNNEDFYYIFDELNTIDENLYNKLREIYEIFY